MASPLQMAMATARAIRKLLRDPIPQSLELELEKLEQHLEEADDDARTADAAVSAMEYYIEHQRWPDGWEFADES